MKSRSFRDLVEKLAVRTLLTQMEKTKREGKGREGGKGMAAAPAGTAVLAAPAGRLRWL